MPATDASIRSRIARMGAKAAVARHGGKALTENARAARQTKLRQQVIEEFSIPLDAPDFEQRVTAGVSLHYSRMALRRAK